MTQAPAPVETSTTAATPAQQPTPATAQNTATGQQAEHMIPKSRFDEVNTKLRDLETAQAKRDDDDRKAKEKQAKERGEWERLATERETELGAVKPQLETAAGRVKALETLMEAQIEDGLKDLPEAIRDLAPSGDVLERYAWLAKARKAAGDTAPRSPGTPAGPRGTGQAPGVQTTTQDLIARKRASGMY